MIEKSQIKDFIRAIQCNPIKELFDSLLITIYSNFVSMSVFSDGVLIKQVYDQKTQTLINKIITNRDDYLSIKYWEAIKV